MTIQRHQAGSVTAGQKTGGQFKKHERTPFDDRLAAITAAAKPMWHTHQEHRQLRGHDFYPPQARLQRIPGLYDTDGTGPAGKEYFEHYFSAVGDFYVAEIDQDTGEAFGLYQNQFGEPELTYVSLPHMEQQIAVRPGRLPVIFERDMDFEPGRGYNVIPDFRGRAIERLTREERDTFQQHFDAYQAAHTALLEADPDDGFEAHVAAKARAERALTDYAQNVGIAIVPIPEKPLNETHTFDIRP